MKKNEHLALLRKAVESSSQASVARKIGRSPAAINQILKGTYAGNPETILKLVEKHFK